MAEATRGHWDLILHWHVFCHCGTRFSFTHLYFSRYLADKSDPVEEKSSDSEDKTNEEKEQKRATA